MELAIAKAIVEKLEEAGPQDFCLGYLGRGVVVY